MKRSVPGHRAAAVFAVAAIVAFLFFFLIAIFGEQPTVYRAEETHQYIILEDLQSEQIADQTAPAGVRKIYRGKLQDQFHAESCFGVNVSHNEVQIYFDDTLVYSLTAANGGRVGRNVGANWCFASVGSSHAGKSVTVVLTPLFEAAIDKEPTFYLGSHHSIAADVFGREIILLSLSMLCILLGLFIFAISVYFRYAMKVAVDGMTYLGLFSGFLGLWKITDLNCLQFLLPQHTSALGYMTVGSLFLTGLCLILYFSTLFRKNRQLPLLLLSCTGSLICLYVVAMQVLGLTEMRQNLMFSHVLVVAAIASVPLVALFNRIVHKNTGLDRSWKFLFLLLIGIALDLTLYYRNNGNGPVSFAITSLIVYTLIMFLISIQDATRKAYTDSHTGLVNRSRWNELMNEQVFSGDAVLVADLNGLKRVNDTLGHAAGDQMIFHFSDLLRNTLPRSSVICRWGGDEFAVLMTGMDRAKLDRCILSLFAAAEEYNMENPELTIRFALGNALSSELPGMSRAELFKQADEKMYRNKQEFYQSANPASKEP